MREAIFGINDGLVATVGLVSGEVLSHQPHAAVVVAALSAAGAATVSMAIGSYLATSSQQDLYRKQIAEQSRDIAEQPHIEKSELEQILRDIGINPDTVPSVGQDITQDRHRWLKFMIREDLGLHEAQMERPLHNAVTMAVAVILGSMPPVVPFLLPISPVWARDLAWGLSLAAAFALGWTKAVFTASPRLRSGLQFALLASASAAVGASIGLLLGHSGV